MKRSSKLTAKEQADVLMRCATSIEHHNDTVIVSAFGHRYKIENAYSRTPRISQLRQIKEVQNEHQTKTD